MTPKSLAKKRDELAMTMSHPGNMSSFCEGFDAAVSLMQEREKILREALKGLFVKIEDGTLVRDISNDHNSDWVMNALDLTLKIKAAYEALDKLAKMDE